MAGNITHSWNGTVLTITSDSGTSSMDLGGKTGIRGPQGPAGKNGKDGTDAVVSFEELTDAQKETLKGPKGDDGTVWHTGKPESISSYTVGDYLLDEATSQVYVATQSGTAANKSNWTLKHDFREPSVDSQYYDSELAKNIYECFKTYAEKSANTIVYAHADDAKKGSEDTLEGGYNAMNYSVTPQKNTFADVETDANGNPKKDANGNLIYVSGSDRTGYPMNCSCFVHLMMMGVPYSMSRYVREENTVGAAGYSYNIYGQKLSSTVTANYKEDGSGGKGIFTKDLKRMFEEQGRYFPIKNDLSNVKPGDILFWEETKNNTTSTSHVAIVLYRCCEYPKHNRSPVLVYADCRPTSDPVGTHVLTLEGLGQGFGGGGNNTITHIGRPNYKINCAEKTTLLYETSTPSYYIEYSNPFIKNRDMLYIEFEWEPPTNEKAAEGEFVRIKTDGKIVDGVQEDGNSISYFDVFLNRNTIRKQKFVVPYSVYFGPTHDGIHRISLNVRTFNEETKKSDQLNSENIKSCKIYRANLTDSNDPIPLAANTHLDDLAFGVYCAETGDISNSLTYTVAGDVIENTTTLITYKLNNVGNFRLEVVKRTSSYKTQILYTSNNRVYMRTQTSTGWTPFVYMSSEAMPKVVKEAKQ